MTLLNSRRAFGIIIINNYNNTIFVVSSSCRKKSYNPIHQINSFKE